MCHVLESVRKDFLGKYGCPRQSLAHFANNWALRCRKLSTIRPARRQSSTASRAGRWRQPMCRLRLSPRRQALRCDRLRRTNKCPRGVRDQSIRTAQLGAFSPSYRTDQISAGEVVLRSGGTLCLCGGVLDLWGQLSGFSTIRQNSIDQMQMAPDIRGHSERGAALCQLQYSRWWRQCQVTRGDYLCVLSPA